MPVQSCPMKTVLGNALILLTLIAAPAAFSANAPVAKIQTGLRCQVIPKSLKFNPEGNTEAVRKFDELASVAIFGMQTFTGGGLVAIPEDSLEFQPIATTVVTAGPNELKSDSGQDASPSSLRISQLIPALQTTKIYDLDGKQLKYRSEIKDLVREVTTLSFSNSVDDPNNPKNESFKVIITKEIKGSHSRPMSVELNYSFKDRFSPGSVSAKLECN